MNPPSIWASHPPLTHPSEQPHHHDAITISHVHHTLLVGTNCWAQRAPQSVTLAARIHLPARFDRDNDDLAATLNYAEVQDVLARRILEVDDADGEEQGRGESSATKVATYTHPLALAERLASLLGPLAAAVWRDVPAASNAEPFKQQTLVRIAVILPHNVLRSDVGVAYYWDVAGNWVWRMGDVVMRDEGGRKVWSELPVAAAEEEGGEADGEGEGAETSDAARRWRFHLQKPLLRVVVLERVRLDVLIGANEYERERRQPLVIGLELVVEQTSRHITTAMLPGFEQFEQTSFITVEAFADHVAYTVFKETKRYGVHVVRKLQLDVQKPTIFGGCGLPTISITRFPRDFPGL